ncbi:hypothetical protein IAU60_003085 [Kwoniella sp. DSM 27419]
MFLASTFLALSLRAQLQFSLASDEMCIPLIFGFPTKFKQDAGGPGRLCPRCNNYAVVGGASRTWFEFFWIPLIPFSKHHIWLCTTCQWEMRMGDAPDPHLPGAGGPPAGNNQGHGQYQYGQQHGMLPPPPHGHGQGQGQGYGR